MRGVVRLNKNLSPPLLCLCFILLYYTQFPQDRGVASLSVTFSASSSACLCVCACVSLCCQSGKQGVKQIYSSVKSKKAPQWAPKGVVRNQAHINWGAKREWYWWEKEVKGNRDSAPATVNSALLSTINYSPSVLYPSFFFTPTPLFLSLPPFFFWAVGILLLFTRLSFFHSTDIVFKLLSLEWCKAESAA